MAEMLKRKLSQNHLYKSLLKSNSIGVLAIILFTCIGMSLTQPEFATVVNFNVIVRSFSVTAIVGLAQMIIIGMGGMNLSLGAIGGLAGVTAGGFMAIFNWPVSLALCAGLAVGALCGLINGLLINRIHDGSGKLNVSSFLVTLATTSVFVGINKGIRYGSAIALLWLFAMLEGVSIFGNSILNEFVVGLSDAIPVLVMGILLSLLEAKKGDNAPLEPLTHSQKIITIFIFSLIFLCGRYMAYFTQAIKSGYQTSPYITFLWTILMGACIGEVCILFGNAGNKLSLKRRAVKFGVLIFGFNWAAFLIFMPLLFSGYLIDVLIRILLDILIATIGYYLTFNLQIECLRKADTDDKSRLKI